MTVERIRGGTSLIDVLDRVLDKGIVVDAWVRLSLVGIDLITVEARIIVASIETYLKHASALALGDALYPSISPLISTPPELETVPTGRDKAVGAKNMAITEVKSSVSVAPQILSVKVLFMSGYTDLAMAVDRGLPTDSFYVQKPFGPTELARRVRAVLDH